MTQNSSEQPSLADLIIQRGDINLLWQKPSDVDSTVQPPSPIVNRVMLSSVGMVFVMILGKDLVARLYCYIVFLTLFRVRIRWVEDFFGNFYM